MSRPEGDSDEPIEGRLRDQGLRPVDAEFTRRVLGVLPPRARRIHWSLRRSFAVTTRAGVMLALGMTAERGYGLLGGGPEALLVVLLALLPAFAAAQSLCGPLIPAATLRLLIRSARNWR
jgi:hypothetical protein